jgi:hypothetical protein
VVLSVPALSWSPAVLVDGQRLAGEHGLVDFGRAGLERAVDREILARSDAEPVARLHGFQRHVLLVAVGTEAVSGLGREVHQGADGGIGARVGALLDDLAEQDDSGDESGGLEIQRHAVVGLVFGWEERPEEDGRSAVEICRARAGDGEREHVGVALADGFPPAPDEGCAGPEEHRGGQDELQPAAHARRDVVHQVGGDHFAHGQDQHGQGQRRSDIELGPEVAFVRQAHIDRLVGRGHMIGCVRGGR